MKKTQLIKQWQILRGLTPIFKEILLWVKCYQSELHAIQKFFVKEAINVANFTVVLF